MIEWWVDTENSDWFLCLALKYYSGNSRDVTKCKSTQELFDFGIGYLPLNVVENANKFIGVFQDNEIQRGVNIKIKWLKKEDKHDT